VTENLYLILFATWTTPNSSQNGNLYSGQLALFCEVSFL
jgi:hypothetical protein